MEHPHVCASTLLPRQWNMMEIFGAENQLSCLQWHLLSIREFYGAELYHMWNGLHILHVHRNSKHRIKELYSGGYCNGSPDGAQRNSTFNVSSEYSVFFWYFPLAQPELIWQDRTFTYLCFIWIGCLSLQSSIVLHILVGIVGTASFTSISAKRFRTVHQILNTQWEQSACFFWTAVFLWNQPQQKPNMHHKLSGQGRKDSHLPKRKHSLTQ